jgi:hypothetical protein
MDETLSGSGLLEYQKSDIAMSNHSGFNKNKLNTPDFIKHFDFEDLIYRFCRTG